MNRKTLMLGLLGVLTVLTAYTPPAHATLADTLAQASSTDYVFLHPKTGNVASRRVIASVTTPGSGGAVSTERWTGTHWEIEASPVNYSADVQLETAIGNSRTNADGLNASEEAAQLLTDSATTVQTRLNSAGAPTPSVDQLKNAMNPSGATPQTVFNLTRK